MSGFAARRGSTGVRPLQIAGLLSLLILWELIAHLLQAVTPHADSILPSVESVFLTSLPAFATFEGFRIGQFGGTYSYQSAISLLAWESVATIFRVIVGTLAGAFIGITVGFLLCWSKRVMTLATPPVQVLRLIPLLALIPLFQLWFGAAETGAYIYISFAVFTGLVINTVGAVRNLPPVYAQFATTLGASRAQVFRTVIIPGAFPGLVGAIRVTLGIAWAIGMASEFLAVRSGLGRLLILSADFFFTGRVIVILLLFMVYSVVLNWLFLWFARRVTRWMPGQIG